MDNSPTLSKIRLFEMKSTHYGKKTKQKIKKGEIPLGFLTI